MIDIGLAPNFRSDEDTSRVERLSTHLLNQITCPILCR